MKPSSSPERKDLDRLNKMEWVFMADTSSRLPVCPPGQKRVIMSSCPQAIDLPAPS